MKVAEMSPNAVLPAEVTIYTVGVLHSEWRERLATVADLPKATRTAKGAATASSRRGRRDATRADAADAADAAGAAGAEATWPVDASGVAEIDAAGLQLLLALAQSLALRGRALRLERPSTKLVEACEAIGLPNLILPPEATGSAA